MCTHTLTPEINILLNVRKQKSEKIGDRIDIAEGARKAMCRAHSFLRYHRKKLTKKRACLLLLLAIIGEEEEGDEDA